jgi:hypothetical protein
VLRGNHYSSACTEENHEIPFMMVDFIGEIRNAYLQNM